MTYDVMELSLSKKQISLSQRLQKICDKISQTILPVEVNRIEAFGSYIRGKPNPNDIDLVLYYDDDSTLKLFYDHLVEIFKKMKFDYDSTPKQIVLQYLEENSEKIAADFFKSVYSVWLEGFTWNHVEYGRHPPYKEAILKRILLGKTKNIHISQVVRNGEKPYMMAKESRVIWSPKKPTVLDNYKEILLNESASIISSELKNLSFQLEWIKFENKIITGLFHHLLEYDVKKNHVADLDLWLLNEVNAIFPGYPDNILKEAIQRCGLGITNSMTEEELRHAFQNNNCKTDVEIVREDLKEARMEYQVISKAFILLQHWKKSDLGNDPSLISAETWVALQTLTEVPKKEVPEEIIRKYLRQNNLPEEKIKSDRDSGRISYSVSKMYFCKYPLFSI